MNEKEDALRRRAEKAKEKAEADKARALESERKAIVAQKALSEKERKDDTRRKVIDGAHVQTEALNNATIAALLTKLREDKLVFDHDRALFGMKPLSDDEKLARGVPIIGKPGRKPKDAGADTVAVLVPVGPAADVDDAAAQSEAA